MFTAYKSSAYRTSLLTYGVLGATNALLCFFIAAVSRHGSPYVPFWTILGLCSIAATIRKLFRRRVEDQPPAKNLA